MAKQKNSEKAKKKPSLAEQADIHKLYQDSVQCVEAEIDFIDEAYRDLRMRPAALIREDFCGTANTSCEWVRRRSTNRAIAVDLDGPTLDWGREHNVAKLGPAASRVQLLQADVMTVETEPVDAVIAHNFSYWLFKRRMLLRNYFETVREALKPDGLFFLDCYGGSESMVEMRERTKVTGFTYIWDQASYNPINGDMQCFIHFKFPDGSRLKRAFAYHWRLWTLPEIREVLEEAGFTRSTVYWEGTDEESGEGDGDFKPTERGEADPAWIVYMIAER